MITVLDPKRSNAINIGLTTLPPVHVIKAALLNFDEFAVSKDGIEVGIPAKGGEWAFLWTGGFYAVSTKRTFNPGAPLGRS